MSARLDRFVAAAGAGDAAEIDVPFGLHMGEVQTVEAFDDVVAYCVGMPGSWIASSVAVDEDCRIWEVLVVFNYEGEIGVCFSPLVSICV